MTTVAELIEELKSLPQHLPISLNTFEGGISSSLKVSDIQITKESITNATFPIRSEQTFVVLMQENQFMENQLDELARLVYEIEDKASTLTKIDSKDFIESQIVLAEKVAR